MPEEEKKDAAAEAAATEAAKKEPRVAKPGQDDSDAVVKGAGGELMSGIIADIADGDR